MIDKHFSVLIVFLGCLVFGVSLSSASPFSDNAMINQNQSFNIATSTYNKPTYARIKARSMERKKQTDMAAMEIRKEASKPKQESFPQDSDVPKGQLQDISN